MGSFGRRPGSQSEWLSHSQTPATAKLQGTPATLPGTQHEYKGTSATRAKGSPAGPAEDRPCRRASILDVPFQVSTKMAPTTLAQPSHVG